MRHFRNKSEGTKNIQNTISNFACILFVYLFSDEMNINMLQLPANNKFRFHEDCLFIDPICFLIHICML